MPLFIAHSLRAQFYPGLTLADFTIHPHMAWATGVASGLLFCGTLPPVQSLGGPTWATMAPEPLVSVSSGALWGSEWARMGREGGDLSSSHAHHIGLRGSNETRWPVGR